ncbi:MAG: cytochrome c-type biogenesis protein CcmH [Oleispira antarctica]|mgnify:CR=1 FL=1|uniref:Cytochrome c-type biogenesis protein n=1 Tax=Oleispira antarctica RB-8 TaxID=698738 RepID=R4YNH9_OLEAN|nr:cytochrome c-type biogenesis protein CcmH [Oleispira antarctica]MBQ0791731.1 cytochrome c-type biogenesis protein CcmH [Oleispira antarctica]CCK76492.1 Cytochrome c-type biogenesis protein CycL [Oleispira antarctica RB-8]
MKLILALCLSLFALTSQAVIDGHKYPFDNAVDEERFEVLAEELRCPKCQNQNLADSNAPVASDLRDKVYELMIQGQTDDQIVGYLVARYGDFVRYNPPVQKNTFFLWFGPGVMVLIALIIIISLTRGGKKSQPLSEEENVKLAELKAARSEKQES